MERRDVPATLPPGYTATEVVGGLKAPSSMAFAPDGRIFVAEQLGAVRVVKDGQVLPTPFVTLPVATEGERGVSGVALDPNFARNGFVYVYYTTSAAPIHNRLSRFTASGDVAVPGSEVVLLDLPPINTRLLPFHNGGALHFGPDGKLYVGVGDHKQKDLAQDVNSPFGKILRLNPDGTIPADNPFADRAKGLGRAVWALGFRNPFTFGFQPGTGRLFVNDVGEATWEEVNDVVAGGNYGWPKVEGRGSNPRYRNPFYTYHHGDGPGQGCAVVGGTFYPDSGPFPADARGDYFLNEYCQGEIRKLDPRTGEVTVFATGLPRSGVDLDIGADGSLYELTRGDLGSLGQIIRITYEPERAPSFPQPPESPAVAVGRPATFHADADGTGPLSYQWQRDGKNIPGATAPEYTLPSVSLADQGARFRVVVTNRFGSAVSPDGVLTAINDRPPVATILAPTPGVRWRLGQTIRYAGAASDPEDGPLPASAFSWKVDLHHNDHVHPYVPPTWGRTSGTFRIPRARHDAGRIWYRVELTVTDSKGVATTTSVDIYPKGSGPSA